MKIKFFSFIFCIWKRIYFARKHSLGICALYHYISGKVSFSVAGYLKRRNETPTSIYICIGLEDVVLWPKMPTNRLGILTSILIVMDCFSDARKVLSI